MTLATSYSYSDRSIFDLKTFLEAIRFIVVNSILAFIFFFLIVEEFEWEIFSSREGIKDKVFDDTSWNVKTLI
tara:strand:- start:793 stop:1011 length:219 start_codon:yes stop_codon:yes gene_type:complete